MARKEFWPRPKDHGIRIIKVDLTRKGDPINLIVLDKYSDATYTVSSGNRVKILFIL
jgi:hypothetical protein